MKVNEFHRKLCGRGVVAIAALSAGVAIAAGTYAPPTVTTGSSTVVVTTESPIVVDVTTTRGVAGARSATGGSNEVVSAIPRDHEAGVRAAARQGPDALRQYVWRTRMVYNFYYGDFAPLIG